MKNNLLFALLFFILSIVIYSLNLFSSYNFDNDFARDLIEIRNIVNGNLTFIGPGASIGIQTGPYYYYIFTPVALITNLNINSILLFNSFLFAFSIALLAYFTSRKFGFLKSALISSIIALLPLIVISARNPGNAFSYIPFLIILLTLILVKDECKRPSLIIFGILSGLILNFHYSNFLIIISLSVFLFIRLKKKMDILIYFLSIFVTFSPLILFEVKNNFVMMKNIFLNHAYSNFTDNTQLAGSESAKANIFENIIFITRNTAQYLSLNPAILLIVGFLAIGRNYIKKESILFLTSLLAFILLIITLRSQYVYFYTFSCILFLTFATCFVIVRTKYYLILIIFIILELISFPVNIYTTSNRPPARFEEAVNYVVNQKIIKSQKFNILQVRPDTIIVPYGNEYRFFFMQKGYTPQKVTEYNSTDQLLIFSEIQNFDLKNLRNNEFRQFGAKYTIKKFSFKNIAIFSLNKTK